MSQKSPTLYCYGCNEYGHSGDICRDVLSKCGPVSEICRGCRMPNHHIRNCPNSPQPSGEYPPSSGGAVAGWSGPQPSGEHPFALCKVFGCLEKHSSHYCKYCRNPDSDHRSICCPQNPGKNKR